MIVTTDSVVCKAQYICTKCGKRMIYNNLRLGLDGGFVHRDTLEFDCGISTTSLSSPQESELPKESKAGDSPRIVCA